MRGEVVLIDWNVTFIFSLSPDFLVHGEIMDKRICRYV